MRKRSRWIAAPALLLLVATACGSDDDTTATTTAATDETGGDDAGVADDNGDIGEGEAEAPGDQLTIGMVSIWCSNPTVCGVNRAFQAEAETSGHRAIVIEADISDPVNSQVAAFDQLIAQGVDAIAFWPIDDAALQAPMQRAAERGIPLFTHDMYEDPTGLVVSSVIQGRELKAKQGAELICEALGEGGGEVLYGDFAVPIPTLVFLKERFESYLAECDGAELVGSFINESDDVDGAQPAAEAALLANPGVRAVFNYNDPTAIGTSLAAAALGRELHIDGYNLSQDGVDALSAGRFDVSWDYRSAENGQALARVMIHYLDGTQSEPPKFVTLWPIAYTPATIGEFLSTDERLELIRAGEYLVESRPEFVTSGDEIPTPPDDIPLPSLAG